MLACAMQRAFPAARVLQASDGREAMEAAMQGADVEAVLMDGAMPVQDGYETTRQLRAAGWDRPIVGVTGNALAEDVGDFHAAGADVVHSKPVSTVELAEDVRRLVGAWRRSRQGASAGGEPSA